MTPTQPLDVEIIQTLEEVSQLLWIGTQLSQICGCQTAGKEGLRAMQHCYRKPGAAQKWSFWTELVSSSVKQIDNAHAQLGDFVLTVMSSPYDLCKRASRCMKGHLTHPDTVKCR